MSRARKKYFPALISSIVLLVGLGLFVIFWSPNQSFIILNISISTKIVFFSLFFLALSLLGSFIFLNYTRGFFSGIILTLILLLRFFGFMNIFYPILLIILGILIDRLLSKRT